MLSARTVLVRLPERDPVACAPSFSLSSWVFPGH